MKVRLRKRSLCLGLLLVACQTEPQSSKKNPAFRPSPASGLGAKASSSTAVVSPQEAMARRRQAAEELLIRAEQASPLQAGKLRLQAGDARFDNYLETGRPADLLEAIDAYTAAADQEELLCTAGLKLALLRALSDAPSSRLYHQLYILRHRAGNEACRDELERSLALLDAERPNERELEELRRLAAHGAPAGSNEPQAPTEDEQVVSPENLAAVLASPAEITKVEPISSEQSARLVIHVTHPTRYRVGVIKEAGHLGSRIYVDLDKVSYRGPDELASKGLLERVRFGAHDGGSRLVLELNQAVHHRVFYLPEPFRLVVDLSLRPPENSATPRSIQRVVLDPGHGGNDPGATSPGGLHEKDVTLDIAHRAAPLLAREVGVSTLLTRDVDVYVPLDERAARANAFHADLFISVHVNSSENASSRGIMSFVLDSSRDDAAARIAARENSSSEAAAAELANSLSKIESADRRASSELLARLLQRSAGASLRSAYSDIEDHGVRRAGFYVLAGAAMPAVLFECSFISHPVESRRLDTEAYRQRLADAIVNAVRAYKEGLSAQ